MIDELLEIASARFRGTKDFDIWQAVAIMHGLESYDQLERLDHDVDSVTDVHNIELIDKRTGLVHVCHICGRSDGFVPEGDVFVCEHSFDPAYEFDYVPIRAISDIKIKDVFFRKKEKSNG